MSDAPTIESLIARLEAAKEGSRELDKEIAIFTGTIMAAYEDVRIESRSYIIYPENWPRYTTSLDAALTLVPAGLEELCIEMAWHSDSHCEASLCWGPCEPFNRQSSEGEARTPALAFTIAALKSTRHMKPKT